MSVAKNEKPCLNLLVEGPVDSPTRRDYAFWGHSKPSTSWSLWMSWPSCNLVGFALLICLWGFCTIRNTTCSFFPVLSASLFMSRISMDTSMLKKSLATASMIPVASRRTPISEGWQKAVCQQKKKNKNQVIQLLMNIPEFTKSMPCLKTSRIWDINKIKK